MTIPYLNKCSKCGIKRHIYSLVDADSGDKVCKDKAACEARQRKVNKQEQATPA